MKRTLLLQHPTRGTAHVSLGFSWAALLLGPIWAIAKRLWLVLALLIVTAMPLYLVHLYAEEKRSITLTAVDLVLCLVYAYICGRYGNSWWRWTLERRGFHLVREENEP
jgi:hypothetical protein